MIQCKRVYEPASPADGRRVLVDRLWPRGIRKEALAMDDWLKEVAPSTRCASSSATIRHSSTASVNTTAPSCRRTRNWGLLDCAREGP